MEQVYAASTERVLQLIHSSKSYESFVCLFNRVLFANCFFSHPSAYGHEQLANAVMQAYNNKISGLKATVLHIDDVDEQIAEGIIKFGLEFKVTLLKNIASRLGVSTQRLEKIMDNSDSVTTKIAKCLGVYTPGGIEILGAIVRSTLKDFDNCTHTTLTKVPENKATAFCKGHVSYYCCKQCGQKFTDKYGKNAVTDDTQIIIPRKNDSCFIKSFYNNIFERCALINFIKNR